MHYAELEFHHDKRYVKALVVGDVTIPLVVPNIHGRMLHRNDSPNLAIYVEQDTAHIVEIISNRKVLVERLISGRLELERVVGAVLKHFREQDLINRTLRPKHHIARHPAGTDPIGIWTRALLVTNSGISIDRAAWVTAVFKEKKSHRPSRRVNHAPIGPTTTAQHRVGELEIGIRKYGGDVTVHNDTYTFQFGDSHLGQIDLYLAPGDYTAANIADHEKLTFHCRSDRSWSHTVDCYNGYLSNDAFWALIEDRVNHEIKLMYLTHGIAGADRDKSAVEAWEVVTVTSSLGMPEAYVLGEDSIQTWDDALTKFLELNTVNRG